MRELSKQDAKKLGATAEHYTAYVGPPDQYDFMGATQFRLLCTLGLREHHVLLDFGCGSLRAGRLFIPYLNSGCYYGVEPNKWLVDDAIEREIGNDIVRIKSPQFNYSDKWTYKDWGVKFDFILAQSIFSHCGADLLKHILSEFALALNPSGIAAVTFIHTTAGEPDCTIAGWIYPGQSHYSPNTILRFIEKAGMVGIQIPWFHPRQTWYLISHDKQKLPRQEHLKFLTGAVLFDNQLNLSLKKKSDSVFSKFKNIKNLLKK